MGECGTVDVVGWYKGEWMLRCWWLHYFARLCCQLHDGDMMWSVLLCMCRVWTLGSIALLPMCGTSSVVV